MLEKKKTKGLFFHVDVSFVPASSSVKTIPRELTGFHSKIKIENSYSKRIYFWTL